METYVLGLRAALSNSPESNPDLYGSGFVTFSDEGCAECDCRFELGELAVANLYGEPVHPECWYG